MYGRKVKLRFLFVVIILITLILTTFLILKSLEENVVYFQSPSEIKSLSEIDKSKIRVGGMVKKNSISISSNEVNFIITDFKNKKADKNLLKLKAFFSNQESPKFHIKAKTLIEKFNYKEGKELGAKLKEIEEFWIENSSLSKNT